MLLDHHLADLHSSALTDETIERLGFHSGTAEEVREILGFAAGPGLVIPYPQHDDMRTFARVKPDEPLVIDGKSAKYLSPKGGGLCAYIPPSTLEALGAPETRLLLTEGEKKAASADQSSLACIGLGGIWGFRDRGHLFLPELDALSWDGRPVVIVPDSDMATNDQVRDAVWELGYLLYTRGALVSVVTIPPTESGAKQGIDDLLVAQGRESFLELLANAAPFADWAIDRIAVLPPHLRRKGLSWLLPRLVALNSTDLEYLIPSASRRLELPQPHLRRLLKETVPWRPNPPRANREEAAARQRDLAAEAKTGAAREERRQADLAIQARELLQDPGLLFRLGILLDEIGLAGERVTAMIIYLAVTSRIQPAPVSVTVKGESAAGKSYTLEKALTVFPNDAYHMLTGMSKQALVYSDESFAHRTIVIMERPGMEAADYNIRTLQSEGKIVFETVQRDPETGAFRTVRVEKEGPTNFIFTTTAPEIHDENETRHWSVFVDESEEQTAAVKAKTAIAYVARGSGDEQEIAVWRAAQSLLQPARVTIAYAGWLAKHTPDQPVRMRRDFARLLVLIETCAILHQLQREVRQTPDGPIVTAILADYYVARALVSDTFGGSAAGMNKKVTQIVDVVRRVHDEKVAQGTDSVTVSIAELATAIGRVQSTARRWLKPALNHGWVTERAPAQGQRGAAYLPGTTMPDLSPLPPVEDLAEAFPELTFGFTVVDPITGDVLTLEAEEAANAPA